MINSSYSETGCDLPLVEALRLVESLYRAEVGNPKLYFGQAPIPEGARLLWCHEPEHYSEESGCPPA